MKQSFVKMLRLLTAVFCFILFQDQSVVLATSEFPIPLTRLCARADEIVEATIINMDSFKHEDGRDYTWISLKVKKVYKGDLAVNVILKTLFAGKNYDDDGVFYTPIGTPYTEGQKSIYLFRKYNSDNFGMLYGCGSQSKFDIEPQYPDVLTRHTGVPLYIDSLDEPPFPQTGKLSSPLGSGRWHYDFQPIVENIERIVAEQSPVEVAGQSDIHWREKGFITPSVNVRPNPFNPFTTIEYTLPAAGNVALIVYSVTGQKVATLVDSFMQAGTHSAVFNGADLASGVYFYRLQSDDFAKTGKMLLVK